MGMWYTFSKIPLTFFNFQFYTYFAYTFELRSLVEMKTRGGAGFRGGAGGPSDGGAGDRDGDGIPEPKYVSYGPVMIRFALQRLANLFRVVSSIFTMMEPK